MRTLGRTHGISVAWLHESHQRGDFELRYEQSSIMAADIFTKGITVPLAFDGACQLVNTCAEPDIQSMCARLGLPPLSAAGGENAGSGPSARMDRGPGLASMSPPCDTETFT